jgi:RNA polymerase sigma-70 factor (ECF subfamily)
LESADAKNRSEEELLRQLKNGNPQAWQTLTEVYGARVYNYLRTRLPGPEDIEDVLGDTLVAAVRAIPNFDGNVSLITFLISLANRKVVDYWRRHPKTTELSDTFMGAGISSDGLEFQELLQQLRPAHRQVLLMRYHLGLGVDEIAAALGQSYKSTESLLSRARQELRRLLDGSDLDDV